MLCHLGDAAAMVVGERPRTTSVHRAAWIVKWLFLWGPVPWPHGRQTNPMHDPRRAGTKPSDFERDRQRAIALLERIAAGTDVVEPIHGLFGSMSVADWQRWAYRHTDYHLRQFGV
jgi:hypothetical protein